MFAYPTRMGQSIKGALVSSPCTRIPIAFLIFIAAGWGTRMRNCSFRFLGPRGIRFLAALSGRQGAICTTRKNMVSQRILYFTLSLFPFGPSPWIAKRVRGVNDQHFQMGGQPETSVTSENATSQAPPILLTVLDMKERVSRRRGGESSFRY